ncbi:MAG: class I SAM-dependent methyltransferase [Pseudomonadota bacterium]
MTTATKDTAEDQTGDWYLDDEFWRHFGSLMFNEDTFDEAATQIESLLGQLGGASGRVLDLGCGPGRHALPLAAQGYPVTAVDTSPSLLAELEQRRGELDIEIIHGDMRTFRRSRAFDLVLVMWTSFGYFESEDDHDRVLECIRDSLADQGRLVLDLVGVEYLARHLEPVHLTEYDDGRLLIERPMLVDDLRRLDNDWLLVDGDRVHRTHISHRVWSAGEIRALLARHGLETESIHGGFDGEPYDLDAERLIVIARKT